MYTGSDNGPTETYMMPGTVPNPQITVMQPPEGVDYMTNEMAPEVIYDQGLYYPAANYYGYFCTGLEPQIEWDDHHRFFGIDGQELHYSALQTESSPYVYYSPSYGYAQSAYNPYNPYIPGAVIGVDGPILGTQQYYSNYSYQLPVSSPTTYIPVVVQPNSDAVPSISGAPSVFGNVSSYHGRQATSGSKHSHSQVSSNGGATTQGSASTFQKSESSQTAPTEVSMNVPLNKQSSSLGSAASGNDDHMAQGRTGLMQVQEQFHHRNVSAVQNPSNVSSNNLPNFGSNVCGWATVDRFRPRLQYSGAVKSGNGSRDMLGEQNRGPRTNRSKGQWPSEASDGAQMSKAGPNNAHEAIIIRADQYNKDDFLIDYPDAKFFVIKSYSEDDVHKSIKYNVWSSTPNGNKRLHSAYQDARRISAGKPRNCPIFLFFSVNASGQFCGVAEMVGPVDFDNDMNFWQQDKWTGSFPVKWYIIKDVPNTSFRHIVLENNENKPVTNSRDTQEVMYFPGITMLNIFKSSPLKTSILDDFMFYEERQKIMQEEKSRFTGRSYGAYMPAIVSASKPMELANRNDLSDQPAKEDVGQSSVASQQPLTVDGKKSVDHLVSTEAVPANIMHEHSLGNDGPINHHVHSKPDDIKPSYDKEDVNPNQKMDPGVAISVTKMKSLSIEDVGQSSVASQQPLTVDGKRSVDHLVTTEAVPANVKHEQSLGNDGPIDHHVHSKPDDIKPSYDQKDVNPNQKMDPGVAISVTKMKSLSIGSNEGNMKAVESSQSDVVTVGPMCINVNGAVEPISKVIT